MNMKNTSLLLLLSAMAGAAAAADTNVILRKVVTMKYSDEGGYSGRYVTNTVAVQIDWERARSRLKIDARMKKKDREVAMVKNQLVAVGDTVKVESDGLIYTWKLSVLEGNSVGWEPMSVVAAPQAGIK
jgi:predicted NAD-dependent protein-ADP-ribosyltransferase YbiA (DUF1768 family)